MEFAASESSREIIKDKLRQNFDGKIVRKDLTKKIKAKVLMCLSMSLNFFLDNIAALTRTR